MRNHIDTTCGKCSADPVECARSGAVSLFGNREWNIQSSSKPMQDYLCVHISRFSDLSAALRVWCVSLFCTCERKKKRAPRIQFILKIDVFIIIWDYKTTQSSLTVCSAQSSDYDSSSRNPKKEEKLNEQVRRLSRLYFLSEFCRR